MEWLFGKYDDGVAALGLSNDPPMVAPSGSYQVRVRVVEAKDLSAILNFSLYKSIMSLSWKSQVEAEDKLPNCQTVVRLQRDGFKDQKRKTIVEKETSSPLWNQLFYFEDVEVAEGELELVRRAQHHVFLRVGVGLAQGEVRGRGSTPQVLPLRRRPRAHVVFLQPMPYREASRASYVPVDLRGRSPIVCG